MEQDLKRGGKGAYAWCKADVPARAIAVQHSDGAYTANAEEVHKLILREWLPIFRMRDHEEPPDEASFLSQFGAHIPASVPCNIEPLTGQKLQKSLKRMRIGTSPGAEGWRVEELRVLLSLFFDRLADLFNAIGDIGVWPDDLCQDSLR